MRTLMRWVSQPRLSTAIKLRPAIMLSAAIMFAAALPAQAQGLPDGAGKETVAGICTQCHSLAFVTESRLSKADWEYIVTDMIGRGAPLMEDEIQPVIDYLAANFGKAVGKININTAKAIDLQKNLSFTPLEAEAIVNHREKNGKFTVLADVQKVAGVDAKKVETARDRIEF
ncbi:MAG: helix-hairpin-helix domain-containing protein [Acidobacteria bacterium]|nr:helix-hairpin-helix domain-containing protein [Acidobacteriota bacterium]